jgi:aminoglycoside/choline kinase family phosphotransferase/UTP-glucose-1-phosphate uridylyltransferase
MKALILAAGYGTRLEPFTSNLPKSLFPIAGRPLLDAIITALQAAGCHSIIINTHHLHQRIEAFLAEQKYTIPVRTRYEPKILGTGGAIRNVADFWDDQPFLVINSDIVTDINLRRVYDFHSKHTHPATLVIHDYPPFNTVSISQDGFILGFDDQAPGHQSSPVLQRAFTGIQVLDPEILDFIPSSGYFSSIAAFEKMIKAGRRIKAFISTNHYWTDIGTPESYRRAVYDKMAPMAFRQAWPGYRIRKIDRQKLQGDGSDRKWYRLTAAKGSLIMADHGIRRGPDTAAVDSFVAIGRHLDAVGLPVPKIYLHDPFSGLVFLEDLGDENLQGMVQKMKGRDDVLDWYRSIIRLLLALSVAGARNFDSSWTYQTPAYDQELILEQECRYFVKAFLQQYLGWKTTFEDLEKEFVLLSEKAVAYSINGFMHRDFQSRNIMVKKAKPYIIDFQGGRIGPVQYDLASLLIDPYVGLSSKEQAQLLNDCIRMLPETEVAEAHKFAPGYHYCSVTRNLQILGAFSYLSNIKKKTYFEKYIPCAVKTLNYNLHAVADTHFPKLKKIAEKLVSKEVYHGNSKSNG